MGSVTIRPLTLADEPFLWEMLYQALYVPAGQPPFSRAIVHEPDLSRYVQDWGRADDLGFVALADDKPIGAVWLRLFTPDQPGFATIDETTPELSIALLPDLRGRGIGTQLLTHLLDHIQPHYHAVCLSVSPDNPAKRLYERLGFDVVGKNGSSLTLVKRWGNN